MWIELKISSVERNKSGSRWKDIQMETLFKR